MTIPSMKTTDTIADELYDNLHQVYSAMGEMCRRTKPPVGSTKRSYWRQAEESIEQMMEELEKRDPTLAQRFIDGNFAGDR